MSLLDELRDPDDVVRLDAAYRSVDGDEPGLVAALVPDLFEQGLGAQEAGAGA
jgi:hypothetical protein